MPPMKKLGARVCFGPPIFCGPNNKPIRHIFFLIFDGFYAHTNTD